MIDILILNAPPQSGKDEIAKYLVKQYGAYHMEVKEMLFEIAIRTSGLTKALWEALYTRDYKELPTPYLQINGVHVSPRAWMIHCSESVIKPMFGSDAFGKAAANKVKKLVIDSVIQPYQLVVFSDGGFLEELLPLSQLTAVPGEDFFLARIHRVDEDGAEFGWGTDSRSYLYLEPEQGKDKDFDNLPGKMLECADEIMKFVNGSQPHDAII